MKTKAMQPEGDLIASIKSKKTKMLLQHVLSPLEQAAMRHSYKPFTYKLDGLSLYLTAASCSQLLRLTSQKLGFITHVVNKESLAAGLAPKLKEILDSPAEILSLPAYTRNRLCAIGCDTMYAVAKLGRANFKSKQGFGARSIAALDALFEKHNCKTLFK